MKAGEFNINVLASVRAFMLCHPMAEVKREGERS
jgi:hypothetical protein